MKKQFLRIFTIIFAVVLTTTNVYAAEVTKAGNIVNQEGEYNTNRFIAGNKVTNEATIDGLSFVAGNEINASGSATYGFYAGNIVNINEKVEKDMFVAGNTITISSSAAIGRDAYLAGTTIVVSTNVVRDLRIGGESIDLSGITIGGDAYIKAENIKLDENTVITGKLSYPKDAIITGLDKATVGTTETTKEINSVTVEYNFFDHAIAFIMSIIAAFITIVVLFYLKPKSKEKLDSQELDADHIIKTAIAGLLILIVIPLVSLIAMFTGVLIPIALIIMAIYAIGIYIASLLTYYLTGKILLEKVFKKENTYLALIIGIILVKLIRLIPILKTLVGAFALFYGLGLIYNYFKAREN